MKQPKINNWPYAIIEELLDKYGESESGLSRFLIETVGIPKHDLVRVKKIKAILENLKNEGILTWKAAQWEKLGDTENWDWSNKDFFMALLGNEEREKIGNLERTRVEAQLTLKGLDYATKLIQANKQYESVIKTNKFSRRNYIITPTLAFLTLCITAFNLYKTVKSQKEGEQKVQQLQTQVKAIDSSQQIHQISLKNLQIRMDTLEKRKYH